MLNRSLILILFGLVVTSAASLCVQIHHPFPATVDEILMKLAALLLLIGVLGIEYLLWCRMELHLPPPPARRRADFIPPPLTAPTHSEQQAETARRYKLIFPLYTLVMLLLLGGCLIGKADSYYYQAVKYGYFRSADVLRVLAGANADNTAILHYCCGRERNAGETDEQRREQVRYLLKNGANPNLRRVTTPIHCCLLSEAYHLLPLLLEYGADLQDTAAWDISPAFHAVGINDPELLKYLLQNGAEPDRPQALFANMTPLHRAVEFSPDTDEDIAPRLECIRLLLASGARANALCQYVNTEPRTPLDLAEQKCGFADAIPLLKKHGALHARELPSPAEP